jgi:hypothetical protein
MGFKTRLTVGLNRLLVRLSFRGGGRVKLGSLIPELKLVMEDGVAHVGAFDYAPNHFILYMSQDDLAHHAALMPALRDAVVFELSQRAEDREWRLLADGVTFDVLQSAELQPGEFVIDARIVEPNDVRQLPVVAPASPTPPPPVEGETVVAASPPRTAPSAKRRQAATVLSTRQGRHLVALEEGVTDVVTAVLKVVRGSQPDRIISFSGQEAVFGRDEGADVTLPGDERISRRHFRIFVEGSRLVIEDLSSGNGTRVGGKLLDRAFLKQGTTIQAGDTVLEVLIAPGLGG